MKLVAEILAMGPPAGTQQDPTAGMIQTVVMFAVLGVMFYFLLIRPQSKQRKEHEALLQNIKSGDRVLTGGGIIGLVANVKEKTFVVKIADNVKVEVVKSAVTSVIQKADAAAEPAEKK
jgi:preprotein translocase subunit YajC